VSTNLGHEIADMRAEARTRVDRVVSMARRTTAAPALVRAGICLAGLVGLGTAWPGSFVLGKGILAVVVLAVLAALLPRGFLPTLVILAAVAGWLFATARYDEPLTLARLVVVAGALYLVHTLAALAAVLPYDAIVSAGVLGGWLLRAALVVGLTAAVALFVAAVPQRVGGHYLVASLAGLAVLTGLTVFLASLLRRR
jgi:hypothetical protein